MNRLALILIIFLSILFGCNEPEPTIQFNQPVKGRKINLSNKIGNSFSVLRNNDTTQYQLSYNKQTQYNYIIKSDSDTVFAGTVTKRNELFLLNRLLRNGKFVIHALQFTDSTVTGLETEWKQSRIISAVINYGDFSKAITDTTNDIHTLSVSKKQGKGLFRWVINQLKTEKLIVPINEDEILELKEDTIVSTSNNDESITQQLIKKVFPNPFVDHINIELNRKAPYVFQIFDMQGKLIKTNKLNTDIINIKLPHLESGQYVLKVFDIGYKEVGQKIIVKSAYN